MEILLLVFLFATKHLIVDFFLQGPYMFLNKGNIRHPGGYVHAGFHGITSAGILLFFVSPVYALLLGLAETIAHYAIDWSKVNVGKHFKWKPDTCAEFWWALGVDQYLHTLTYIAMIMVVI